MNTETKLTQALFKENLNSNFTLVHEDQEYQFTLKEVKPMTNHLDKNREAYSLVFELQLEGTAYFNQHMFELQHAAIGPLTIFMVPIGPDPETKKMHYEAIFN